MKIYIMISGFLCCMFLLCTTVNSENVKIKAKINPKDGAEMVYVPAGEFVMGSDDPKDSREEKPRHKVYLDGYWIYKYEVTVGQYKKFCKATGRQMPPSPKWGDWEDKHPIGMVSWDETQAYAKWAGGRIPTEAEWEKAARGTDGRKFPWGNDWGVDKCNNYDLNLQKSTPVGSYPKGASPYGCHDMSGNVWEWCSDNWNETYYAKSPSRNPKGPSSGGEGVVRGGSWSGWPDHYRCSVRLAFGRESGCRHWAYGFRLVVNEKERE